MATKPTPPSKSTAIVDATPEEIDEYKTALTPDEQAEFDAFMGAASKDGKENINADDIVMPRISLLQDLSPQVKERKGHAGDFYNIISDENYGSTMQVVGLLSYTSRIKWDSPTPGANIECVARDGENGTKYGRCVDCKFRDFSVDAQGKSVQPACTEFKNLILIPRTEGGSMMDTPPAAFSAKRASLGAMKNFFTRVTNMRHNGIEVPMYSHIWEITGVQEKGDKGEYWVPKFEDKGMITNISLLKYFQGMWKSMKDSLTKFDIKQDQVEDVSANRSTDVIDAKYVPSEEVPY
jgi:hypothetical protein